MKKNTKTKETIICEMQVKESHKDHTCFGSIYCEVTDKGCTVNNLAMGLYKDGSAFIYRDDTGFEDWIYLYPEQVKHLKKVLNSKLKKGK